MTNVEQIFNYINGRFPFSDQEPWDNSGLLCGCTENTVENCIICLDIDGKALRLAEQYGAELIISHHPLIFNPVKNIENGSPVWECIRIGASAICSHTPFDKGEGGTNDVICRLLELNRVKRSDSGILRLGELEKTVTVKGFAGYVSEKLDADVRYTLGNAEIRTVAVCTGAGGDEFSEAIRLGADALLTGEAKYHELLEAKEHHFPIMSAGHFETEHPAMAVLCEDLQAAFPAVRFILSKPERFIFTKVR